MKNVPGAQINVHRLAELNNIQVALIYNDISSQSAECCKHNAIRGLLNPSCSATAGRTSSVDFTEGYLAQQWGLNRLHTRELSLLQPVYEL